MATRSRRVLRLALPTLLLVALAGVAGAGAASQKTVWLCFPGRTPDPCASSLATTAVAANGKRAETNSTAPASPPVDCFYVYPTVSSENRGNADLQIQLPELLVAQTQASRFSQVCRVYAPMYRQITDKGLTTPSLQAKPLVAYNDVLAAWNDYLAHDNHGRGVVLIGHSQGAYILKHLIATELDRKPAERRLLVSAILLGGQVLAPNAKGGAGGSFKHVPACATATATGCVIAYSSFGSQPPANARFGRSPVTTAHVLCVNPAAPGSTSAVPVTPLFPSLLLAFVGASSISVGTPWVALPDLYTAQCKNAGGASWLQITRVASPGDKRPTVKPLYGASWGLHATDVNIALTELVHVVAAEAHAFSPRA